MENYRILEIKAGARIYIYAFDITPKGIGEFNEVIENTTYNYDWYNFNDLDDFGKAILESSIDYDYRKITA